MNFDLSANGDHTAVSYSCFVTEKKTTEACSVDNAWSFPKDNALRVHVHVHV